MYNDYDSALDKVYAACLYAAPDESTRRAIKKLRADIAKPDWFGNNAKECTCKMAGVLYDGLAYGNWPHE